MADFREREPEPQSAPFEVLPRGIVVLRRLGVRTGSLVVPRGGARVGRTAGGRHGDSGSSGNGPARAAGLSSEGEPE